MATCEKSPKGSKNDVFVYGHDTKKFRLRAVSAEKDTYSKFISKPLAKKVSCAQLILAALICGTQIVTMNLVLGRYVWDSMANSGGGLWSSSITTAAALLTLWSLKNTRYWKLHLSFAVHIISALAATVILIMEFGGNINYLKWRVWDALYEVENSTPTSNPHFFHYDKQELSASMLITSLILNTFMATGTLFQLGASFLMTLMTGRAICCGQSKAHGKLFELEIAGSETADGMAVLKNQIQNNLQQLQQHGIGNANVVGAAAAAVTAPPPYAESVAESNLV